LEVKILEKTDTRVVFTVHGISTPFANALRRIMIAEVPTMAIDDVIVVENSSAVNDEIIAHRLGLIPLKTDLDTYLLPEECTCHSELGCNRCRVALTLEASAGESTRTVYSGEIKSENPEIVPISDKIPIVKLAPGQRIRMELYARLGKGKMHAKWQPVSVCSYKYFPAINISVKRCDACGECVAICPKHVLKIVDGKLKVDNLLQCTLCSECVKRCPKKPPAIKVESEPNAFIFFVESTGALPVERIVSEAARILLTKVDEFIAQASKLGEPKA
jgi:DNA-directed RNA polymerase subunit D